MRWLTLLAFCIGVSPLSARGRIQGECAQGNNTITTVGIVSTTKVRRSFPSCTVTVYSPPGSTGGVSIYSDMAGTSQANPFTADATGHWTFYSDVRVDVALSGAGISPAFTIGDLAPQEEAAVFDCSVFAGANGGAKISNCLTALAVFSSTGGVADASLLIGNQTATANIAVGAGQTLRLGAVSLTLSSATITLANGAWLKGLGQCRDVAKCTTIRRTAGTATMISATGISGNHVRGSGLESFYLDGGGTAGHGMVLDYVDAFTIRDVFARNGGASNALRLLDEVWDFSVINSSFTIWGDAATPTIQLSGLNGSAQITDGHWYGNAIGEIGNGNPLLIANGYVLQQRFVDNKFHHTGGAMPYLVDWSGYRSSFIGCSFQADTASATGGMVRIKNSDNQIIGGEFSDVSTGDAIHFSGSGDGIVSGVTIRGGGAPSPGAAVVSEASSSGRITVTGNDIINLATGYDFSTGTATISIGPSNFSGVTTEVNAGTAGATWKDFYNGKGTATFGGVNLPTARSAATLNPTLRLGGNTATNSAGYQGLYLMPLWAGGGQLNELIGVGSSWNAGFGSQFGTNIEHPIVWGFSSDASGDAFASYVKSSTPLAGSGRLWSVRTNGDVGFRNNNGQHIVTFSATSDTSGALTLDGAGGYTLTFAAAYTAAPICVASDTSAVPVVTRVQTSTTQLILSGGTAGHAINYICVGNPN